jgi:hypothetical protein
MTKEQVIEEYKKLPFDMRESLIPREIVSHIIQRYPASVAVAILQKMWYASDHFAFEHNGMYHGVEYDGYIHT